MKFTETNSYKKLKALAEQPIDLTQDGAICPKRIESMQVGDENLRLIYGMQRVTDEVMENLYELARERNVAGSISSMRKMEVVNKIDGYDSEFRMVGHMAMRNLFGKGFSSSEEEKAAKGQMAEWEKLEKFVEEIEGESFDHILVIGIGGSFLGTFAVATGLKAYNQTKRTLSFIPNIDPDDTSEVTRKLDPTRTITCLISKSGGTLEILSNCEYIKKWYEENGIEPKSHMICVTGEGSPLDDASKYRASFYMWDFVGGRYSASCMVGCVPLALTLGIGPTKEFLEGMNDMDQIVCEREPEKNIALTSALLAVWNRNFLGHSTLAIIPYIESLKQWPSHLQQLFMESNGKQLLVSGDWTDVETCPVIFGYAGTDAQHSFFQQFHQGTEITALEMIGFRDNQYGKDNTFNDSTNQEKLISNMFAQSLSLAGGKQSDNRNKEFKGNRGNNLLIGAKLTPYILGLILSYYEAVAVYLGFLWGTNPFDQEGVQLGKVNANKIIDLYRARNQGTDWGADDFPEAQALIRLLDQMKNSK
ncbi:MAG: Glucose-6-phosphate isomerase [Chlamydiia bacterium]|nr:Glucose-6-phosphate isomerase [Chlamydiia bacterium]